MAVGLVVAVAATLTTFGQDAKIERGKYLVEEVGRCQECHTPKNEAGELDKTKWMKGATLGAGRLLEVPADREEPARRQGGSADAGVHAQS